VTALRYLAGYPPAVIEPALALLSQGRLRETLARRYPDAHSVRNDRALGDYVGELKARFMKSSPPLARVKYDDRLHLTHKALGTHTAVSRVQGAALKASREIRIASVFKDAPAAFLRMIVVHELAHLREREHDKAFYALCRHMAPDYAQLEFDTRCWLTALELEDQSPRSITPAHRTSPRSSGTS
jgi:predicted metal-dependent hydrolase